MGPAPSGLNQMDKEQDSDPFRRRPVLLRTPEKDGPTLYTPPIKSLKMAYDPKSLKDAIAKMGSILKGLSAVIFNKGQRHINQLMKDEITNLMSIQKKASTLCAQVEKKNANTLTCSLGVASSNKSTQTDSAKFVQHTSTESAGHKRTPKRPRESLSGSRTTPPKKPKNVAKGPTAPIDNNGKSEAGDTAPKKPHGDG